MVFYSSNIVGIYTYCLIFAIPLFLSLSNINTTRGISKMNEIELTVNEATEILEITNLEKLSEKDLNQIRKKAKRRWHPDTISYTNPTPEIIKKYEHNFRLIEDAIAVIMAFLNGDEHFSNAYQKNQHRPKSEAPEDVILRNSSELQQNLRKVWESVKQKKYKMQEEEAIVSEGFSYKDILMDDLKEDMPVISVVSFVNCILLFFIVFFIGGFAVLFINNNTLSNNFLWIITVTWAIQALSCVIAFLPLSRFWLPYKVGDVIFRLVDFGLGVNQFFVEKGLHNNIFIGLIIGIPIILAQIFKWLVLFPLYKLVSIFLGDRRIGVVKKKTKYYAGLASWYIEDIMQSDPKQFSSEQLFDLSYIYGELKDA